MKAPEQNPHSWCHRCGEDRPTTRRHQHWYCDKCREELEKEFEELKKEHVLSKYDKQYIESVEDKCSNYFDILNKLKVYFEAKIETEKLK